MPWTVPTPYDINEINRDIAVKEKELKVLQVKKQLVELATELNGDRIIDWTNNKQSKYIIDGAVCLDSNFFHIVTERIPDFGLVI